MGQRHQIFVIARVQGRYRCIAAFHSQWLYGGLVVKTAARLIRAFVNPINAAIIASELAILEGLDTSVIAHENNVDHENPAVLCPYLTGLFLTCSRVDMDEGRMYHMRILPTHILPSQTDNNDGYTCFDLTEQGEPQYCFWWPGTRPLTAYEYLSMNPGEDKQLAPAVYGIFGHCALLGLDTLAEVWPGEFRSLFEQWQHDMAASGSGQTSNERLTPLPNSPAFAHSAASAFDAIKETRGPSLTPEVISEEYGLLILLFIHLGPDAASRLREHAGLTADPGTQRDPSISSLIVSSELRSGVSAGVEMVRAAQSSNPDMNSQDIVSLVESMLLPPENLDALREELLEAKTLGPDDICRLKQLIAAERYALVDFKPWFSTGALDASVLLDFSDALNHAKVLDLSLSSTLTVEIVEALVSRLPNLRHIIAFNCERLLPPTTALPLTSYLTSLPVVDAIDQGRLRARLGTSAPECLRWVEESDPPAGLTIVMRCPPLSLYTASDSSTAVRRYGVELSYFGAEGVIRGFARYLQRLYQPDYRPSESSCYFEMRAYFHSNGSSMLRECILTHTSSSPTFSFGCLPSLIRDASPGCGQAYPAMTTTTASGAVTAVPRHPGWVLTLDTKDTLPYHRDRETVDIRTLFKGGLAFLSPRKRRSKGAERSKKTAPTKGRVSRPVTNDASSQSLPDEPGPSGASATSPEEPEDDSPTPRAQCVALPALDDAAPPAPGGTSTPTPNNSSSSPLRDGAATPTPKDTSSAPPRDGTSNALTPKEATAPLRDAPRPEYAFERWDVVPGQTTKELRVVERVSVREWVSRLPAGHGAVPEALLSECEAVLAHLNVVLRESPAEPVATD